MSIPKNIEEFNQLYNDAESCDQDLFAEQRSNIMLVAGEHYNKKNSKFWQRIRDNKDLSEQQKLRLVKNHVQKICKLYLNNIISYAPGVKVLPRAGNELRDVKCAQLAQSIWEDAKQRYKLPKRIHELCKDFVDIGECAVKIFFDPNRGPVVGYHQKVGEDGQPVFGEDGQPEADKEKVEYQGEFVFERILGPNLLRAPEAKSSDESRFFAIRKMFSTSELKKRYEGDEEKTKMLTEDQDETFMVYDGNKNAYTQTKDQTLIREFYFRPCAGYPNGWYSINTKSGILEEGELPGGVFPIVFGGFDEVQTTPRCRSIIKVIRPYQAEINRASSKMAEHQITLGDDKLVIMNGTKITAAGTLPGLRGISVTGVAPTVLPGRDGSQYLPYLQAQISEMYQAANLEEDSQEKDTQADAFTLLYRSMRNKKKYSLYATKFERFLVEMCEVFLELARLYLPDDMIIPAVGRAEAVNIVEFKTSPKEAVRINLEPMGEDIETQMGKQLVLNHALQYTGSQMSKEDIGKLLKNMPFANLDASWDDLTIDYDNATNDILALDRGEKVSANPTDDHKYMIKKITNRQKKSDYKMLPPEVQQNYDALLKEHEQIMAQQAQEMQRAQSGFIPMDGYSVVCDLYVPDKDPSKQPKRARVPYSSLQWLIQKLEEQGASQAQLDGMNKKAVADMSQMIMQGQPGSQGTPPGPGGMPNQ